MTPAQLSAWLNNRDQIDSEQRATFGDDTIIACWPISSAAWQIRRERVAELAQAFERLEKRINALEEQLIYAKTMIATTKSGG